MKGLQRDVCCDEETIREICFRSEKATILEKAAPFVQSFFK